MNEQDAGQPIGIIFGQNRCSCSQGSCSSVELYAIARAGRPCASVSWCAETWRLLQGCTPLHWAAIRGHAEACTLLLQVRRIAHRLTLACMLSKLAEARRVSPHRPSGTVTLQGTLS